MSDRLDAQLAFLAEADKLKSVLRASRLMDGSRRENSAEHSWHFALFALVLRDEAPKGVDIARVIAMALIHDLVEIDAGDTPIHGAVDAPAQARAEQAAARRLFGLLPEDQGATLLALWEEFEAAETPDAIFAKALDRMPAPMQNLANDGGTWADYDVTPAALEARVGRVIDRGAPRLWAWLSPRIDAHFAARHGGR